MKRRTGVLLVIFILVAAAVIIGIRLYNERTPDIARQTPDFETDITSLLAAFDKDTSSAVRQYIGKIGRVKGTVRQVDTSGALVLGLEGEASSVVAGFDKRHLNDLKDVKSGDDIIIQGLCSGYERGSSDPDDLLSGLGTTVQFRSAGLKRSK